jgi:hypothetical protein
MNNVNRGVWSCQVDSRNEGDEYGHASGYQAPEPRNVSEATRLKQEMKDLKLRLRKANALMAMRVKVFKMRNKVEDLEYKILKSSK